MRLDSSIGNICGIYYIYCTKNNKGYIGKSVNIRKRILHHIALLNRENHHSRYLQNSWNKYGREYFKFEILARGTVEYYSKLEYWFIHYSNINSSFNVSRHNIYTGKRLFLTSNKLKEKDVFNIVKLLNRGISCNKISNIYNVDKTTIQLIKSGNTWGHISKNVDEQIRKNKGNKRMVYVFNKDKKFIASFKTMTECASYYGLNINTLNSSCRRGTILNNKYFSKNKEIISSTRKVRLLKDEEVLEIINYLNKGYIVPEISKILNIKKNTIYSIKYKRNWKKYSYLIK